jgi:hypothetical protein
LTVQNTSYKDVPAVLVQTQTLQAWILPEDGGKIASLRRKKDGKELLVTKPAPAYKRLAFDGSYVDSECSGFDDMFPTVDPDQPQGSPYPQYPDHGECCRLSYGVSLLADGVTLSAPSRLFPVTYTKTVRACPDQSLSVCYRIENRADSAFPFLWAGHMMLAGEQGMRVLTPFSGDVPTELMFADPMPEAPDKLPRSFLQDHRPGKGTTYKFYYLKAMPTGDFGVLYPDGSALSVAVDPQKLPYLGVWLNNGTFQNGYSITLEPCTLPFDAPSAAAKRGLTGEIPANGAFTFEIKLQLKEE